MRLIDVNDLPLWSPWPWRLLGFETYQVERTREAVLGEYEDRKYAPLLKRVQEAERVTLSDVKHWELGDIGRSVAMVRDDQLYGTCVGPAAANLYAVIVERVQRYGDVRSIVDLGCGYGYLLGRLRSVLPEPDLWGGEIAPSARVLARLLFCAEDRVKISHFDFYADDCEPLARAEGPVLVVTCFALHQLRSAARFVRMMYRYREKIERVINLEPVIEAYANLSLLGLMRERYERLCDYSADLLDVLRCWGEETIEVEHFEPNVVGTNALLPGSLVVWRFR